MTAQTPTVLKSYFETGDRPTASQYGDFIDTACGYKSYVATLTQAGTAAPVATVLQNTIGDIVWTRSEAGRYVGTLANAFVASKTVVLTSVGLVFSSADSIVKIATAAVTSVNAVVLLTGTLSALTDDGFGALGGPISLEIRVYP
ncbi:MAG: hypothetical protein IPO08_25255 [Xanthomonadales bacterium]|nr:hypothetical protein [Xanthomonadales bacterium]